MTILLTMRKDQCLRITIKKSKTLQMKAMWRRIMDRVGLKVEEEEMVINKIMKSITEKIRSNLYLSNKQKQEQYWTDKRTNKRTDKPKILRIIKNKEQITQLNSNSPNKSPQRHAKMNIMMNNVINNSKRSISSRKKIVNSLIKNNRKNKKSMRTNREI